MWARGSPSSGTDPIIVLERTRSSLGPADWGPSRPQRWCTGDQSGLLCDAQRDLITFPDSSSSSGVCSHWRERPRRPSGAEGNVSSSPECRPVPAVRPPGRLCVPDLDTRARSGSGTESGPLVAAKQRPAGAAGTCPKGLSAPLCFLCTPGSAVFAMSSTSLSQRSETSTQTAYLPPRSSSAATKLGRSHRGLQVAATIVGTQPVEGIRLSGTGRKASANSVTGRTVPRSSDSMPWTTSTWP